MRGMNIRRDDKEAGVWRPAGMPATLREDAAVPLQRLDLPGTGRQAIFMQSGTTLGAIITATSGAGSVQQLTGTIEEIGTLDGEPLRFDVVAPGLVRVLMRHSPTNYISYDTGNDNNNGITWQLHGPMPCMPALSIATADEVTLSESFGGMNLSGSGTTRGSLPESDGKIVSDRIKNAYARLKAKASGMGLFLQPTVARYRLLDAAGDTIAVSPPVLVGATGGFQCSGEIKLTSTDALSSLGGGAVTSRAYRVRLTGFTAMPHPWNRMVRSVVLETLRQIDPVDAEGTCANTVSNNGSTTTVAVRLAGFSGDATTNSLRNRNHVVKALAESTGSYLVQSTLAYPFNTIPAESRMSLREDAPAAGAETHGITPWRDSVSFHACHTTGGELFMADPRTEEFTGYPAANYAVELTADGQISAFSPLLVHPDENATQLTLTFGSGDTRLTATYPLTPVRGTGMAYYLASDLTPMAPQGAPGQPSSGASTAHAHIEHGVVARFATNRLWRAATRHVCTQGVIMAIADAPRSRSTWDFSRHKLLLFGADGIHVATLNSKGEFHAVAKLDNRAVASPHAVCVANSTKGLSLMAVAGGDVVEVEQGSVSTILRHCRGERVGWCSRFNELWLSGGGAPLRRITGIGKTPVEIEANVGNSAMHIMPWHDSLLLIGNGALLDATHEVYPPGGVSITIVTRHESPDSLRFVRVNAFAAAIKGTITLSGDNGTRIGAPLLSLKITGALNAPLTQRLMAPHRKWVEMQFDATVTADAEWHAPEFG